MGHLPTATSRLIQPKVYLITFLFVPTQNLMTRQIEHLQIHDIEHIVKSRNWPNGLWRSWRHISGCTAWPKPRRLTCKDSPNPIYEASLLAEGWLGSSLRNIHMSHFSIRELKTWWCDVCVGCVCGGGMYYWCRPSAKSRLLFVI